MLLASVTFATNKQIRLCVINNEMQEKNAIHQRNAVLQFASTTVPVLKNSQTENDAAQ